MHARETAASVLAVSLLTGCLKTIYDIPVSQAPRLGEGVVPVKGDSVEQLGSDYTVRLVPFEGAVLVYLPNQDGLAGAYPRDVAELSPLRELERVQPLAGPIHVELSPQLLVISNVATTTAISPWAVKGLRVAVPSPGKTTALVLGAGAGVGVLVGLIAAVVVAFQGFNLFGAPTR